MNRIEGIVPAAQPFDLAKSIQFLAGFPPCAGDQDLTATTITKGVSLGGQATAVRMVGHSHGVHFLALSDDGFAPAAHAALQSWVSNFLSLGDDLGEFYALAAADARMAPVVKQLSGLHHVRFPSLEEAAVWFVLTQRAPRRVAVGIKRRIMEQVGRSVTVNGASYLAFPELTDLCVLSEADWLDLVRNPRKASYLFNVVNGLNELGADRLRAAPYDEAYAALRRLHGVGDFTAAALLLRGLGRMDHVPLEMKSFDEPARALYGNDFDAAALRAHYGRHLGYWSYYLKAGGALQPRNNQLAG